MTTYAIQFDDNGNVVEPETNAPNIQTREEALSTGGPAYGATVRDVNAENEASRIALDEINSGPTRRAVEDAELDIRVHRLVDNIDRMQAVSTAGRSIENRELEALQAELIDISIMHTKLGGDVQDPTLIQLRSIIDSISMSARLNRR